MQVVKWFICISAAFVLLLAIPKPTQKLQTPQEKIPTKLQQINLQHIFSDTKLELCADYAELKDEGVVLNGIDCKVVGHRLVAAAGFLETTQPTKVNVTNPKFYSKNFTISSTKAQFTEGKNEIVFKDNVLVDFGSRRVKLQNLVVKFDEKTIKSIEGTGNPIILEQNNLKIEGEKMNYEIKEDVLILEGKVKVHHENHKLSADKLKFAGDTFTLLGNVCGTFTRTR